MSAPKRQHWVPRFYLRQFAVQPSSSGKEQVWIFHRKHGSEPILTSIENIAVEKYLYSPPDGQGVRDFTMERRLADLESTMAILWPELANGFVDLGSSSVRKGIALFLAIQLLRHPTRRDSVMDFRSQVLSLLQDHPRDSEGVPIDAQIQIGHQIVTITKDLWEQIIGGTSQSDTTTWVGLINDMAIEFAEILLEKRWSMVFVDEPLFVTSDFPFYVASPEHKRFQIGGKKAVISFPVSPTRTLCFDDLDVNPNRYHKIKNEDADLYNLMTWVNTDSYMISGRDVDEVLYGCLRVKEEHEKSNC